MRHWACIRLLTLVSHPQVCVNQGSTLLCRVLTCAPGCAFCRQAIPSAWTLNIQPVRSVEFHHGKEGGRSVNYAGMSNFVMTVGTDDLASVFAQGQIGLYHDWCYMFPSYPRSFDLTHVRYASGLRQVTWFKGTTYAKHVRQASSRKGSPGMVLNHKRCTNAAYTPCASAALTTDAMHVPSFPGTSTSHMATACRNCCWSWTD